MRLPRTRFRTVALLAAGAALVGTAVLQAPATAGTSAAETAATPAAVNAVGPVIWEDNFDGPNGQAPDAGKWRFDIGGSGWGNNERQYYTNSTRNAAKDGAGNLVITARRESGGFQCHYGPCEYTSARLLTAETFTQTYGRYEARMKLPRTQGIWPAFWMLGTGNAGWPGNGEIDIMEHIGKEPTNSYGTLHGPGYSAAEGISSRYTLPNGQVFGDGFHTFTVDWEPNAVTWYVDGIQFARKTPADLGGDPWVFDHPFFMIMNVAVGGYWPGYPDGSTVMPQSMVVDYVRVNSLTGGGGGGGNGAVKALGKCMDVAGANPNDGTPVQIWDCNNSGAQQWTRPGDGTVRALGKCLDIAGGGTADGTKVQIANCSSNPAQQWNYTGAQTLVNPQSGKCLDLPGGNTTNGTRLQIWPCNGQAPQKWTL